MNISQECFNQHVASPTFQDGADRGWWGLLDSPVQPWPHVLIWVAAPVRPNSPSRFILRFTLEDYPAKGPTATLWDETTNSKLAFNRWPKGSGDVQIAFRTDYNNADALYVPWDRVVMDAHSDWPAKFPGISWRRSSTIVQYLRLTRELLDTSEYHGI